MNLYSNLRQQFPIFDREINAKPLVYLDSAATTQKPQVVIDSQTNFYSQKNASNHGVHFLANQCSLDIEKARQTVADFLGCRNDEIVFTAGSTNSLNLLANSFLFNFLDTNSSLRLTVDSKIIISVAEHHSNILPWQRLATLIGCKLEYVGINQSGRVDLEDLELKLKKNIAEVNLVCINHVSNVLGMVNPINVIAQMCHNYQSMVIVDGTQAISHLEVDTKELNVDFYCFSGHKIYAPTGVGVLYGKYDLFGQLNNDQVGGEMVNQVELESNSYKPTPWRFEAGTSNFASIVGLDCALNWFTANILQIQKIESDLKQYLYFKLLGVADLTILGTSDLNFDLNDRIPLFTCYVDNVNSLDLCMELDFDGIAIRSGQHCTGLLHQHLDIFSTWRVSLAPYNTREDIDFFVDKLQLAIKKLR